MGGHPLERLALLSLRPHIGLGRPIMQLRISFRRSDFTFSGTKRFD